MIPSNKATDFVQQKQTVKHPVTGEELEVLITQYFVSTPGVFYRSNGDPGDPPSIDDLGEPTITLADGSAAPEWVVQELVDWDKFDEADMQSVEETDNFWRENLAMGDWPPGYDETDARGNNFSDADPGL